MRQPRARLLQGGRESMEETDLVTPSGPQDDKYLYPDLAGYLCAAWLAYTFGESLPTALRKTPTNTAELGSMWHNLAKAVFRLAGNVPD